MTLTSFEKVKHLLQSKTFWFNLVTAAASEFVAARELHDSAPAHVVTIIAVVNIMLRMVTTQPVRLR